MEPQTLAPGRTPPSVTGQVLDLVFGLVPAFGLGALCVYGLVMTVLYLKDAQPWVSLEVVVLALAGLYSTLCLMAVVVLQRRVAPRWRITVLAGLCLGSVIAAVYVVGLGLALVHGSAGDFVTWAVTVAAASALVVAVKHIRRLTFRRTS